MNAGRTRFAVRLTARQGIALAVTLTCVAGLVDTVGYIALYQVFTANMTGNTIAIGRGVIEGDSGLALRRGFAIPMFVLGLQNAALTHFGPLTVRTTHVTGNLAKLADAVAQYLVWLRSGMRAASLPQALAESRAQRSFRKSVLLAAIWISYLAGALLGAYLYSRGRLLALLLPIGCLLILVALDAADPIFTARKSP